jgi:hypothetical protein
VANPHDHTVPIFINRRNYEVAPDPVTGRQILAIAGLGDGYDLLLLSGEGDPTGGQVVLADQTVEIRAGMHFRAIPGNRTFGDNVPPILREHAQQLSLHLNRPVFVLNEGGQFFVVVEQAALLPGAYNVAASDILLIGDHQYPMSAMDMFWMEEPVTLANGSIPGHASAIEHYIGRQWRRWSWHRNGLWTPGVDDLLSHWAFVEACWTKEAGREPTGVC